MDSSKRRSLVAIVQLSPVCQPRGPWQGGSDETRFRVSCWRRHSWPAHSGRIRAVSVSLRADAGAISAALRVPNADAGIRPEPDDGPADVLPGADADPNGSGA